MYTHTNKNIFERSVFSPHLLWVTQTNKIHKHYVSYVPVKLLLPAKHRCGAFALYCVHVSDTRDNL